MISSSERICDTPASSRASRAALDRAVAMMGTFSFISRTEKVTLVLMMSDRVVTTNAA